MAEMQQIQGDMRFVSDVVRKAEAMRSPASIPLLWAAIVLCGFPLADFRPQAVGLYWMVAGPAGLVASCLLGWRDSVRQGQVSRAIGWRHGLHWGVMLGATFLAVLMPASGSMRWEALGPINLLILALTYLLGAVHLERPLLWPGLLMAAGYVLVLYVTAYAWTLVGVLMAVVLSVAGLTRGHSRAAGVE